VASNSIWNIANNSAFAGDETRVLAVALKDARKCSAHAKSTGQPCRNPAVIGGPVCRLHGWHGEHPKAPPGNPNIGDNLVRLNSPEGRRKRSKRMRGNKFRLTHGLYSRRIFVSAEEREFFEKSYREYRAAYSTLDEFADDALLKFAVYNLTLVNRATMAIAEDDCPTNREALNSYAAKMSEAFRQLGIRRDCRIEKADGTVSPQQWIAGLQEIAKAAREREAEAQAATAEPAPVAEIPQPGERQEG
jgi:hypothetical protein